MIRRKMGHGGGVTSLCLLVCCPFQGLVQFRDVSTYFFERAGWPLSVVVTRVTKHARRSFASSWTLRWMLSRGSTWTTFVAVMRWRGDWVSVLNDFGVETFSSKPDLKRSGDSFRSSEPVAGQLVNASGMLGVMVHSRGVVAVPRAPALQ